MSQKLQAAAWNGLCINLVVVVAYWNHPVIADGRSTAFLLLGVLVGLLCILEWLRETAWTLWAGFLPVVPGCDVFLASGLFSSRG